MTNSAAVHTSAYNDLVETSKDGIISFGRRETGRDVFSVDLKNPALQIFPYTAALFAGALVRPKPASVLSLGLGAGAFNRLFEHLFAAELTTVEVDAMVVNLAKERMAFAESQRNKIVVGDARDYLATADGHSWDWIVSDMFVKNSRTPPRVATFEFYQLVKARLKRGGVFVVNAPDFPHWSTHLSTVVAAFKQVVIVQVTGGGLIFVCVDALRPSLSKTMRKADTSALPRGKHFGLDFSEIQRSLIDLSQINRAGLPAPKVLSDGDAY